MNTPTPWKIAHNCNVVAADGITTIAGMASRPNAELIVRAVNSHQEILKALERLTREIHGAIYLAEEPLREAIGNTNMSILSLRVEESEKAIAKAKGQSVPA